MHVLVVGLPDDPPMVELKHLPGGVTTTISKDPATLIADAPKAEVLFNASGHAALLKEVWPHLTNLKWIHSRSAGLEHMLFPELCNSNIVLTNAKGQFSHTLGEYCITAMLYFAKNIHRLRSSQAKGEWDVFDVEEIRGKTLGIVGSGDIGKASAKLARAFDMRILAFKRRPAEDPLFDKVYGPGEMKSMLAESDYVLNALPYTPDTHHLMGAEEIKAMKSSAVLINLGRGKTIDEPALIDALKNNVIKGAALDVFETEPLPKDHPIFSCENCLVSPHNADRTSTFLFISTKFFCEQVKTYMESGIGALQNVCDKAAGY